MNLASPMFPEPRHPSARPTVARQARPGRASSQIHMFSPSQPAKQQRPAPERPLTRIYKSPDGGDVTKALVLGFSSARRCFTRRVEVGWRWGGGGMDMGWRRTRLIHLADTLVHHNASWDFFVGNSQCYIERRARVVILLNVHKYNNIFIIIIFIYYTEGTLRQF